MMDWDEARKETIRFMRDTLGSGYIREYYESFADELLTTLKMIEEPDPAPEETPQPTAAESVVKSMTFAQAEALLVDYQREKLERQRETK